MSEKTPTPTGGQVVCPKCGAAEIEANTPRTVYGCGSSDYDQRPETFSQAPDCTLAVNAALREEVERLRIQCSMQDQLLSQFRDGGAEAIEAEREDRIEALTAELARLREEREKFFWELGQIKMTIDGTGQIEGAGWSEAHKAVVGLAESHQVMIRTNAGHMDNVEQLTEISKNQHSELSTLRATNAGLVKRLGIADKMILQHCNPEEPRVFRGDWACAECKPHSEILKVGFVCAFHAAKGRRDIAAALDAAKGGER